MASEGCDYRKFCRRHRYYDLGVYDNLVTPIQYSLAGYQIDDSDSSITATLSAVHSDPTGLLSDDLNLSIWFYQNGIMRAVIEEPDSDRFRISKEGISVQDEMLVGMQDLTKSVKQSGDAVEVTLMSQDG